MWKNQKEYERCLVDVVLRVRLKREKKIQVTWVRQVEYRILGVSDETSWKRRGREEDGNTW